MFYEAVSMKQTTDEIFHNIFVSLQAMLVTWNRERRDATTDEQSATNMGVAAPR